MFGRDYLRERGGGEGGGGEGGGGKGKGERGALLAIDTKLVTDQCVSTR